MEVKKIKILLENYISRNSNSSWGKLTATTFNVNVFLTQDIKDMGRYLDYPYIPYDKDAELLSYEPLPTLLADYNFNFLSIPGANFDPLGSVPNVRYRYKTLNDYIFNGVIVTGATEDRLDSVASYGFKGAEKYVPDFDVEKGVYFNYLNQQFTGVTRVISINDFDPIIYTEDADINDPFFGTIIQSQGILFQTYTSQTRTVGVINYPLTKMAYQGQALNETNSSLSAITMEEYLLHITQQPKIENDVFIDRGTTGVLQSHLQMGEITNIESLVNYNNGYYNITK